MPLDLRIDRQRFRNLPDDFRPAVVLHAPRRVDDEDDVLAVGRDTTHGVFLCGPLVSAKPFGFGGKLLLCAFRRRLQGGDHLGFASGIIDAPSESGEACGEIPRIRFNALRFALGFEQFGLNGLCLLLDVDDLRLESRDH